MKKDSAVLFLTRGWGDASMLALETTVSINDHSLVAEGTALPVHADHARVIVLFFAGSAIFGKLCKLSCQLY